MFLGLFCIICQLLNCLSIEVDTLFQHSIQSFPASFLNSFFKPKELLRVTESLYFLEIYCSVSKFLDLLLHF